jgi:hypothetical protein
MKCIAMLFLLLPLPGLAASLPCSIPMQGGEPGASLPGLARISPEQAREAALGKIRARSKEVVSGELEVEQGCLVYSFDIRVKGKKGVEEIFVDAGDGKILSHKHESTAQEAAERAKDAKASGAGK